MSIYGYARISTKDQSIERQLRNIKSAYGADVVTFAEAYTGTKVEGRKQFEKLLKLVKAGDTIVFDSVSRMSRNASEGVELYERLYAEGVELVFLKEPHINTTTYKASLAEAISATGDEVMDAIIEGLNKAMAILRKRQIIAAFQQAQKEVDDLHERTREGMLTAKLNGKQIGQVEGAKLNIKKAEPAKAIIKKHSKDFGGTLNDAECMQLARLARNTYYKYKREIKAEEGIN